VSGGSAVDGGGMAALGVNLEITHYRLGRARKSLLHHRAHEGTQDAGGVRRYRERDPCLVRPYRFDGPRALESLTKPGIFAPLTE
jgi:hypothetical protein